MRDGPDETAQVSPRDVSPAPEMLPVPSLLNGRYQLTALLGRGGMGVVYRATDVVAGGEVALKMLRGETLSTTSLSLFKAEFMTLGKLEHPNIAVVRDFAQREGTADFFFTMELVPGTNALDGTVDAEVDAILAILLQVLRALAYLHTRNVIHLDLKPANVLVTPDGAVRVVDFGIARSTSARPSGRYATPIFVAPEVSREGAEVDRRADIYSFGVTLFQLLFRRLPAELAEWELESSLGGAFALSSEELASVPSWIPEILPRLVARDPAQRFRSANEVIAAINEASGRNYDIETDQTRDSYVASAALVGHGAALSALLGCLQRRLRSGVDEPLLLLCTGPSGSGKSRVLREIRQQCQIAQQLVFDGYCYGDALAPYAAWENVIPQAASFLASELQAHRAVICQLAPAFAVRMGLTTEERLEPQRLARGVVDLLLATGRPTIVTLADIHWIDSRSLELFELVLECCAELQRERSLRLSFLCTSRDDWSDALALVVGRLRLGRAVLDVTLKPLSADQVGELVLSMLGPVDMAGEVCAGLALATGGNALLVSELVHAWIKDGTLTPQASGWAFRRSHDVAELGEQLAHLLRHRLAELSPLELQSARALAVFGRPLRLQVLEALLAITHEAALEIAFGLREKHLAFLSHEQLHFSAARWRDCVLDGIEPDARAELHLRLAELIAPDADAGLVAHHYELGRSLGRASTWYGRAALDSYQRGNLKQVLTYAEQAAACGANDAHLGQVCAVAAEAGRLCGDSRAVPFARRALSLLRPGSPEWMQASRVAIALFNPLLKPS